MTFRKALLRLVLAPIVLTALWIGFTSARRFTIERQAVETLAPAGGQWVEAAGSRVFIQRWGRRFLPAVLLVHGTGGWSGTWFGTPQALVDAGWQVVAVDLPPFGFSRTSGAADYRRTTQAQRLLALIDPLQIDPVVLVGHSFGAGRPSKPRCKPPPPCAVLVDPALGLGPHGEAPECPPPPWYEPLLAQRELRTALVAAGATPPWFSAFWLRGFVADPAVVKPAHVAAYQRPFLRREWSDHLGDWAAGFARAGCEAAGSMQPATLAAWASGGTPIDLIWGERDAITPLAQATGLQQALPQAHLTVLPGLGHIPHLENPAAFQQALVDLLRR
jgi:pimeloyl-ACP methyl ester carboxylesterase